MIFAGSSTDAERMRALRKGALRNGFPFYLEGKDTVKIQQDNWTVTRFVGELGGTTYISQSSANKGKRVIVRMYPSEGYETTHANGINTNSTETDPTQYAGIMTVETALFGLYDMKTKKSIMLANGNPLWVSQEITPGSNEYLRAFINLSGPYYTISRIKDPKYDANGILIGETILTRQSALWALEEVPSGIVGGRVAVSQPQGLQVTPDMYSPLTK